MFILLTNCLVSPRYSTWTTGLPPWLMTLKGKCFISDCTSASSNLRPIRRLASNTLHMLQSNSKCNMQRIHARIVRVQSYLVLRSIANETLWIGKCDIWGCCTISLIISNDFYTVVLPYTNTAGKNKFLKSPMNWKANVRVCGTQINTNSFRGHLARIIWGISVNEVLGEKWRDMARLHKLFIRVAEESWRTLRNIRFALTSYIDNSGTHA